MRAERLHECVWTPWDIPVVDIRHLVEFQLAADTDCAKREDCEQVGYEPPFNLALFGVVEEMAGTLDEEGKEHAIGYTGKIDAIQV